jgi:hypothetical protein
LPMLLSPFVRSCQLIVFNLFPIRGFVKAIRPQHLEKRIPPRFRSQKGRLPFKSLAIKGLRVVAQGGPLRSDLRKQRSTPRNLGLSSRRAADNRSSSFPDDPFLGLTACDKRRYWKNTIFGIGPLFKKTLRMLLIP